MHLPRGLEHIHSLHALLAGFAVPVSPSKQLHFCICKSFVEVQAMLESLQLAPHPSNPQDILVTRHALKALPSELACACQRLYQQLTHIHLNRQPMLHSQADARAELMGSLDEVQGEVKADSLVAESVRACLLAIGDEAQVRDTSVLCTAVCSMWYHCDAPAAESILTGSFYTSTHSL